MKDTKVGTPTEGPWVAAFVLADNVAVAFHIAGKPDGSSRPLAVMGPYQGIIERYHWSEGELRANAHLLAAAWDMREVLDAIQRKAEARLQGYDPGDYGDELWEEVARLAIAALAKSRGEA